MHRIHPIGDFIRDRILSPHSIVVGPTSRGARRFLLAVEPGKTPKPRSYPQVSNAAPSGRRTVVRQDWALVAVAGPAGWGGDWSGSSW